MKTQLYINAVIFISIDRTVRNSNTSLHFLIRSKSKTVEGMSIFIKTEINSQKNIIAWPEH